MKKIYLSEALFESVDPDTNAIYCDTPTHKIYRYDPDDGVYKEIKPGGGGGGGKGPKIKLPWPLDNPPVDPNSDDGDDGDDEGEEHSKNSEIDKENGEKLVDYLDERARENGYDGEKFEFKDPQTDEEMKEYLKELDDKANELEKFLDSKGVDKYSPTLLAKADDLKQAREKADVAMRGALKNQLLQQKMNKARVRGVKPDQTATKIYRSIQNFLSDVLMDKPVKGTKSSYSAINPKNAAYMDMGMEYKKGKKKIVKHSPKPVITLAVFYDRSGSWSPFAKTMTARRIVDGLYVFTNPHNKKQKATLKITEFGFNSYKGLIPMHRFTLPTVEEIEAGNYDTNMPEAAGGENFYGNVMEYIKENHPDNVLIITDGDTRNQARGEELFVKYAAWFLYVAPAGDEVYTSDIHEFVQGNKLTEAFYIEYTQDDAEDMVRKMKEETEEREKND